MKKIMRKACAVILALAMCLSMACTVLAADGDTYTITISNATSGYTYSAYKIFDATVSADGKVAYTLRSDSPWFGIVTGDTEADAGGVYTTDLFKLTPAGTGTYSVQLADGDTEDADIIAFFNEHITVTDTGVLTDPADLTPAASGTAAGAELILDVTAAGAGYYFVTSGLGSVVTITTTNPQSVVIDKNTRPGNLEKDIWAGLEEDSSLHEDTEAVGDNVEFLVTADVPLYSSGDEEVLNGYLVTDYEFDDEMTRGLEIRELEEGTDYTVGNDGAYYATDKLINHWIHLEDKGTGEVYYLVSGYDGDGNADSTIKGVAYNVSLELIEPTEDENGEIQFDGFILTYDTIPDKEALNGTTYDKASEIETAYPVNASINIDYEAHVTGEVDYDNVNAISMMWHMTTFDSPNWQEVQYTGEAFDQDDVYVLELDILKVDAADHEVELEGAEFTLEGTNLNEVVTGATHSYDALNQTQYLEEKEAGTDLWFHMKDGTYTDVDPYDLLEEDPDADLSGYAYDDREGVPEDYHYIAYTRTVDHDSSLTPGEDHVVTGTTGEDGTLTFTGLTVGDWTLTEITAPEGYNMLTESLSFSISVSWVEDEETGEIVPEWHLIDTTPSGDTFTMDGGTVSVTVENNQGAELPSTGGIGTTIFYIIGGVIIAGAVVLLVSRRRTEYEA